MGATITSARTGFWHDTGTWVGGVVPSGSQASGGDIAIAANGHVITVDVGQSHAIGYGATPATVCLKTAGTNGTGRFIINGTLTYFANIQGGNATWVIGAGGFLIHGNTVTSCSFGGSDGNALANAKLVLAGTGPGSLRATWTKAAGAVRAGQYGNLGANYTDGGRIESTWGRIEYVGGGSDFLVLSRLTNAVALFFDNTIVENCGEIHSDHVPGATSTFRWKDSTYKSPAATSKVAIGFAPAAAPPALTTGQRAFIGRCRIEGQVMLAFGVTGGVANASGFSFGGTASDDIFMFGTSTTTPLNVTSSQTGVAAWRGVAIWNRCSGSGNPSSLPTGTLDDLCVFRNGGGAGNHHWVTHYGKGNTTLNDAIFEPVDDSDPDGDCLQVETVPTVLMTLALYRPLFLPAPNGKAGGSCVNVSGSGTGQFLRIIIDRPTFTPSNDGGAGGSAITDTPGGSFMSENCTGYAAMYDGPHNGIGYRKTGTANGVATSWKTVVAAGNYINVFYNWLYRMSGTPYYNPTSKYDVAPGVGDTAGSDPLFANDTVTILKYMQQFDASITTGALAIAALLTQNDDTGAFTSAATLAGYRSYIRAGWTPQNPATATAGLGGTQVGAIAYSITEAVRSFFFFNNN